MASLVSVTGPVQAQAADRGATVVQDVEEVVVTGVRTIDMLGQDVKRANLAFVDSRTAEEIARLPDATLAEALDRIVGVSMDTGYNTTQARTVTLRGFDARYNSMAVDGNPIWNSSRNNRGTQNDVFPSSVVHQLNVFKTVTPDFDANSIGGHIELRTLRAFDGGPEPYVKARASVARYDQSGAIDGEREPGYWVDGVGKFTFGADNRFGAVLGFDMQDDSYYDEFNLVTGWAQVSGINVPSGSIFSSIYDKTSERRAFYGKLEAHATDRLYAFVSANYFNMKNEEDWYRGGVFVAPAQVQNAAEGSGSFTGAPSEIYLEEYDLDRTTLLLATGLDYRLSDRSVLFLRGSYTDYDHEERLSRGDRFQFFNLSGDYGISRESASITLTPTAGITDPANWRHRTGRERAFDQLMPHRDHVSSFNADYAFNNFEGARGLGFKGGIGWRRLDRRYDQTFIGYLTPNSVNLFLSDVLHPNAGARTPTGTGPVFIDAAAYWAALRATSTLRTDESLTADYRLTEDVPAAHASLTFATDRLRALIGARVERTEFENATADTQSGGPVQSLRRWHYTEVLPNVQLWFDLPSDWRIRAAYTEALARPDFSDFAMGQRTSFDGNGFPVIDGANPYLEPRLSKNYDLGVERYFSNGFISLGLFYKDLQNETFLQRRETRNDQNVVILTEQTPLNTGSASVAGVEAGFAIDRFTWLPAVFDGFGIDANYTYLDGEWNVVFTDGSRRTVDGLRNQPRWLANLNLSYSYSRFELELGWRLRGRTFTGKFGATEAGDSWIDDYDRIDLTASFALRDYISVFAGVRNLNDEWWVEQTGLGGASLVDARNPGRSYWVGVKSKL